jgi:hypothetical protein
MTGRRAVVGLSLLCALAFSAFGAASASAVGTTAFTCVKGGGSKDFKDAHCKEGVAAGTGEYGHVAFTETTDVSVTNDTTGTTLPITLVFTSFGIGTEIKCTTVSGESGGLKVKNLTNEKGEMHVTGPSIVLVYAGCSVPKPKNCQIASLAMGLTGTSFDSAEGKGLKFTGSAIEQGITTFIIENKGGTCATANVYSLKGTVNGSVSGATLAFSPGNDSLLVNSSPADLSGTVTTKNTASGTPISITTE